MSELQQPSGVPPFGPSAPVRAEGPNIIVLALVALMIAGAMALVGALVALYVTAVATRWMEPDANAMCERFGCGLMAGVFNIATAVVALLVGLVFGGIAAPFYIRRAPTWRRAVIAGIISGVMVALLVIVVTVAVVLGGAFGGVGTLRP
ncbi:hypothetical protein [Janibacter sp. GXQ6167]|uniref:hypothetical protein n=1 Tax=Janibacter sp. GXQ6167 TaxID=3240791 RepID=UPI00352659D4